MTHDRRLASFALTLFPNTEVVCAYAAPLTQYFGDQFERWIVFGTFSVPIEVEGRLRVTGFRTPGVTANCAIFAPRLVEGSLVQISSDTDAEAHSGRIVFSPGVNYQIAARAISEPSDSNYFVVRTATLVPP